MAIYMEEYKGFLYDVPNIDFVRCDGQVYHYDNVSTASSNFTNESTPINGGWGRLPIGFIETGSGAEITFSSAEFGLEMFEMANAVKEAVVGDYGTVESDRFAVEVSDDTPAVTTITLPFEVKEGSVKIRGLEEVTSDVATGKFSVDITAATAQAAGSTVITLFTGDATEGQMVRVSYKRRIVNGARVIVKNTSTTAKGELYLHYPISSSGDDCTETSILGYVHVYLPRVRATALPGFDGGYKSAQTPGVTFTAIDAKRTDKKQYDITWEPVAANGDLVTKSSAATVDWD